MAGAVEYSWRLRQLMAEQGMWQTTDLSPPLRARGVQLSTAQVYRLVTQRPHRLSLSVLAALCDILECSPADLISVHHAERGDESRRNRSVVPEPPAQPDRREQPPQRLDEDRARTIMQNVSSMPADFGAGDADRAYVLWAPNARRGRDGDTGRDWMLGLIWRDPGEQVWHATGGDAGVDPGGPFRTLHEARTTLERGIWARWGADARARSGSP